MGYRSEVLLALKAKHIKAFLEYVVFSPEANELFDSWCKISTEFQDADNENGILFHWESIKWYDSYTSVNTVMSFLNNLIPGTTRSRFGTETSSTQCDYYYIRIGEEVSDIELQGLWWNNPFDITLERGISYSGNNRLDLKELENLKNVKDSPNENRYTEILKEIQ
jgi:hypothetical protein